MTRKLCTAATEMSAAFGRTAIRFSLAAIVLSVVLSLGSAHGQPLNCAPVPPGLVGWWRAESNALDYISQTSGTLVNGTGFSAGEVGQAFVFNGVNQTVRIANTAALNPASGLTLEAWINLSAYSSNDGVAVIGKDNPYGGRQYLLGLGNVQGKWVFRAHVGVTNGFNYFNGTTTLQLYTWYHVVMTYDGATLKLYVNGALDGSMSVSGPIITTTEPLLIGGSVPGPWNFNGRMDEVSLYSRALTVSEIQAVYAAQSAGKCASSSTVPPSVTLQPISQTVYTGGSATFTTAASGDEPLSYQWRFNGTDLNGQTGTALSLTNVQFADAGNYSVFVTNVAGSVSSSNALLTVLSPPTNCTPAPAGLIGWWQAESDATDRVSGNPGNLVDGAGFAPGKSGQAFMFDGISQEVEVPNSPALNPVGALTIEAWVNVSSHSANDGVAVVGKDNPYSERQYLLGLGNVQNQWVFRAHVGVSSGFVYFNGTTGIQPNNWYHVAMTYDGAALKLYVNGVLDGSMPVTGQIITTSQPLHIGGSVPGPWNFHGRVDELSLYSRALTVSEIQAIYSADSAGKCAGPVAPSIALQPASRTVYIGDDVSFSAAATGDAPLSYQWRFNGVDLNGQTGTSLNLTNVQLADAGNYSVAVTNVAGSALSSSAALTVLSIPTNCTPAPAGLISWWRAEGDATDRVGGNSGSLVNGAGFAPGEAGQSFVFNGSNQVVRVPDAATLNPTNALTLEAWVNVSGFSANDGVAVFGKDDPFGGRQYLLGLGRVQNQWVFRAHVGVAGGFEYLNGATPIGTNAWYHVAMTYDGAALNIYVNGSLDGSLPVSGPLVVSTSALLIGGSVPGPWNFNGRVDELGLYARALSEFEIQTIFGAAGQGKCAGAVAPSITLQPVSKTVYAGASAIFSVMASGDAPLNYQWRFNGTDLAGQTGATLNLSNVQLADAGAYSVLVTNVVGSDLSADALLTVLTPSTNCIPAPSGLISWWRSEGDANDNIGPNPGALVNGATFAPGKVGMAFSFNGTNQAVEVADAPSLNPTNGLTIEGWVMLAEYSANDGVVVAGKDDPYAWGARQYLLGLGRVQNRWAFRAHVGVPAGFQYFDGATSIQTNSWYHVAMTYDGGQLKLYVNGIPDGSLAVSGPIVTATNSFRIGSGGSGPWNLNGQVDELSLYDHALSAAEIQAIYNAGENGKCPVGVSPTITQQPAGGTVFAGSNVKLTVTATGDGPLAFQWRLNGASLPGQTSTALNLTNVRPADAGSYSVVVTNRAGSALSTTAQVKGNMRVPAISAHGFVISFTGVPGHSYALQRAASATGPWTTLTTVTLGLTGESSFEDTNLPPGAAFYRTVSQ